MKTGFTVLTVSQLNYYVHSLLEADANLNTVFLRGEISNFKNHYRSGHFYLSLKDEKSLIHAVMFRSNAMKLRFLPQDGMKVIVTGRVALYERDGQYQFYIEDMQPEGVGALHIAFEQLKEKLEKEGLFNPENKRPLPRFPERIGVITSETGAALQDILQILQRRWPLAKVVVASVLVQGDEAPKQIAAAIKSMNQQCAADVLIVGRGGGSIEDLWAFNDETVARCIVDSTIPIVSAVGHETDFTIADFVADVRAPTPSAAAELVSPDQTKIGSYLLASQVQMALSVRHQIKSLWEKREQLFHGLKDPMQMVNLRRMKVDMVEHRLATVAKASQEQVSNRFGSLVAKLDALSPLRVMARGFAAVFSTQRHTVAHAKDLKAGESVVLRFSDGQAHCLVRKVKLVDKDEKGMQDEETTNI